MRPALALRQASLLQVSQCSLLLTKGDPLVLHEKGSRFYTTPSAHSVRLSRYRVSGCWTKHKVMSLIGALCKSAAVHAVNEPADIFRW